MEDKGTQSIHPDLDIFKDDGSKDQVYTKNGMNKTEYFTSLAMQGLCANTNLHNKPPEEIALKALSIAAHTLAYLEKSESEIQDNECIGIMDDANNDNED